MRWCSPLGRKSGPLNSCGGGSDGEQCVIVYEELFGPDFSEGGEEEDTGGEGGRRRKMQLHFSPSMRSITISSSSSGGNGNGSGDLMKIKLAARHISYRTLFHTILILAFLLPFVFILTALVTLEGVNKCSSIDCLGRRLGPKLLGRTDDSGRLVKDLVKILNQVNSEKVQAGPKLPDSFSQLVSEMKNNKFSSKEFALILKGMMEKYEREIRESKFAELMNKHFAASAIPKGIHCLSLRLTDEYSSNAHARKQLPSPELLPLLSDNSYHHFVLSTDNILAAAVVVTSAVQSSVDPAKIVFHVITDKKTYAGMHSWFALNPVPPAIVEVKGVHQFDWLTRENVPVLEAVENHNGIRNYYHGNHIAGANLSDTTPRTFASKLQARSPKYISLLNHLRIYLPELFPNLDKVVFLDDDVVIQRDLSPLWKLILMGKLMELLKLVKNLKSNLTLWKLGTLPPALIAFKGHVHPIDPSWHMLGLGYQNKTNIESLEKAAVIHYNGQSKPWLEIGFEHLRPFWTKYVNYSSDFIRNCHIL
ncbi:UNVERIFIED_CONTAM: putative galacturonosyltransferase 14 [Sesamum latifolium]|uniref:Hexosyltransferase n=1 Tax=Sesamum latifolium TaxID=2727402 RepID=A0AAW2X8L7_9LAMI